MRIRPAAVADLFYPGDPHVLRNMVDNMLEECEGKFFHMGSVPKALLVPHAGYIYSGVTAAYAYNLLRGADIRRVVMAGPSHRVPCRGLVLPDVDFFSTPLGDVPLDLSGVRMASACAGVSIQNPPHILEHSLEVQLPFLQRVLDDFSIVPLVLGKVSCEAVSQLLHQLWGDARTLILISSDLSHFHDYREACAIDRDSLTRILNREGHLLSHQACGATGINGLLSVASEKGLTANLLDYRNSGDTAGDKMRVVGYASVAFYAAGEQEIAP
ncbi:MAG: AmmeMemoRadiSam system protein B [Zetaproteobacteria bacterium CG_4_9_14_3_um_filter_49_83]|nr:MAG: AmmeMemoRadiSam system protein B [Zetaproteobacteria bacterium CG1_02_49_23]PIV30057.1 MAG: AmmeMemoRadiSam system protein B [Zetaproteobacteria bacterium CG02_land_8_20_14_3_00_50_9]PIY56990.1 MAG: AmmeMemoRadiSam system protein B [Zetaproteobacteria bacterium CG_4_10_14_0_8_um_filter_49_80]PJA34657.1 MAG: AmmeMemoRadiSam system protein B [Zetaproteobacteria bacterium CG_4_9_14_3_um_filter_49_83]